MVLPVVIALAARDGDTAAIIDWFSTGDPDEIEDGWTRWTLLHVAAKFDSGCDVIRVLLERGATVDQVTIFGETPLHFAAQEGHHYAAILLLDRGAQINLADNAGWTPLIWASISGHCDMIRLLLSRGAALDTRGNDGRDAEACARNHVKDEAAALLADVRLAGGTWGAYLRFPRKRVLALRVLCERGRASTDDALLRRLFPAAPPAAAPVKRWTRGVPRRVEEYRAAKGGRLPSPRGIFWHILEYWRCDCDSRY